VFLSGPHANRAREPARWPQPPKVRPKAERLLGRFGRAVDALIRRLLWAAIIRQRNRRAVDAHIHRPLRAVIIRQRNQPRFLFRHLRSRGTSIKAAAGAAFSSRGRWFCSNHPGLTRAYLPAWFFGKLYRSPPGRRSVHRLVASRGWRPIIWVCEAEGGNSGGRRPALLFAREVANIVVIP
jgi:hypothetical protein